MTREDLHQYLQPEEHIQSVTASVWYLLRKGTRSVFEIAEEMRADFAKIPEIIDFTVSTSENMGSFGGSTVDVEVYGYDIQRNKHCCRRACR